MGMVENFRVGEMGVGKMAVGETGTHRKKNNVFELRTIRTLANSDLGQFGPNSDLSCG